MTASVLDAPPLVSTPDAIKAELLTCAESPLYFIGEYCSIYDATQGTWVPFRLWPGQVRALKQIQTQRMVLVLKARQLGLSFLCLAYALWLMLFRPTATVLIFSKREAEAKYLLGPERLQGMYARLPADLKALAAPHAGGGQKWTLTNGSTAEAFPWNGGDGRTATLAIVDEFDLLDAGEQNALLTAVKPTIDAGAQLLVISKAHKATPLSPFKRMYQAAPGNGWTPVFLPWHARPDRTPLWYAAQEAEILSRTGATDELYENYPATDTEALAPPALDKRFPAAWLLHVQAFTAPQTPPGAPALPDLVIYIPPQAGHTYVIGADPAEGNPMSDESAACVGDKATGAQVALLAGRIEPSTFGQQLTTLAAYYNGAAILCERNNHGHAVLAKLFRPLRGSDGRDGWLTTGPAKARMYDNAAVVVREGDGTVADPATWHQLASIDGNTLSAPPGLHDDRATAWVLMQQARLSRPAIGGV